MHDLVGSLESLMGSIEVLARDGVSSENTTG